MPTHTQSTYLGRPTRRSVLYALWDAGDESSNEELAELVGVAVKTVASYRRKYRYDKGEGHKDPHSFYTVCEEELPLRTIKGWVWCVPRPEGEKMNCDECPLFESCQEAVKGEGYLGCEQVFVDELLPGYAFPGEEEER